MGRVLDTIRRAHQRRRIRRLAHDPDISRAKARLRLMEERVDRIEQELLAVARTGNGNSTA